MSLVIKSPSGSILARTRRITIAAFTAAEGAVTTSAATACPGAKVGKAVLGTPIDGAGLNGVGFCSAWTSAADVARVSVVNPTGAPINVPAFEIEVFLLK